MRLGGLGGIHVFESWERGVEGEAADVAVSWPDLLVVTRQKADFQRWEEGLGVRLMTNVPEVPRINQPL